MEHNRGRFEVSRKLSMFDKQENKQNFNIKKNENGKKIGDSNFRHFFCHIEAKL